MPRKPVLFALAAILVLAVAFVTVHAADEQVMPAVGQAAPTFTLPSQDGSHISLKSFRGKWVVLYFYPKDMTKGCTIEAHNFQRDQAKFDADNAVILLADPAHKVVDEYGSLGHFGPMTIANRNTFLIDPKGKIVKEWTKVDPQVHSEEVLAALAELKK
jgi:peroxiredoxin Q/BCP